MRGRLYLYVTTAVLVGVPLVYGAVKRELVWP